MLIVSRLTSVCFDRPRALPRDTPVPLPDLIDDVYLSETTEGRQPQSIPSRMAFFVQLMKLWDLREKSRINETQFLNTRRKYSGQDLGATLDYISDLDRLLKSLPPYLQRDESILYPAPGAETCFQLQGRVLKAM
jgi:hypothetical protein